MQSCFTPAALNRRTDATLTAALAANGLLAAILAWNAGVGWPVIVGSVLLASAGAGALWWRWAGTGLSATGLGGLLTLAALASWASLASQPAMLLNLALVLSLLPSSRRWWLVAGAGATMAGVVALAPTPLDVATRAVAASLLSLQAALLVLAARRNEQQMRQLFDVEFLVRAMGSEGAIRLDLGVVRAETAIGQRLKDVQDGVAGTLQQVRLAAEAAAESAGQLRDNGEALTQRTQHVGGELGGAAMTLQQIAVIVKDSANAAMTARQSAQAASALADDGSAIVSQMVSQMQTIDVAARRITDIIGVIESISFQTNMLALNAAVEAARAGEQGRGFAVVAAEVRMLAQRAARAASEVKTLVENSVQAVGQGNALARQAGTRMQELTAAVARVDQVFHSLSADTHEHAVGLEGMRDAMNELNALTQSNLQMAQQSQQIADLLADRAAGLNEALQGFRLPPPAEAGATGAASASRPAAVARAAVQQARDSSRTAAAGAEPAKAGQAETVEYF